MYERILLGHPMTLHALMSGGAETVGSATAMPLSFHHKKAPALSGWGL